jgi:alpha-L-arabinofuranosidase
MENKMRQKWIIAGILLCGMFCMASAAEMTITVQADKPGAQISPTMWGIFFEDINFGADGGIYAELVKNRSFEFPNPMIGWSGTKTKGAEGTLTIMDKEQPDPANPHYLRIESKKHGEGFGVTNEGFRGMGVREGQKYYFSVYARSMLSEPMTLQAQIVDAEGKTLAQAQISDVAKEWENYNVLMTISKTCSVAKLNLLAMNRGLVDVDMVSLFPEDSAQQMASRPVPGLRKDLVKMLAELKPGLFRFPGGCIVEGRDLESRYQWKNTIGDINQRKLIINRWNTEFKHRLTPDYYQSFGLGFYEYFLLSEQIGAEPLPIINCGMACQFNTAQLVPMDQLQPYVQDALDLIEFANGAETTTWGAKRAAMGHPKPFGMKMLGVGNEQWGPQYIERYKVFVKAIKEKYPDIKLIGATGSDPQIFPNGPAEVKYLQTQLRKLNADIIDEHFYRAPDWFLKSSDFYDKTQRSGAKIFVGEYAAINKGVGNPENTNTWQCALAEAAFMTGLERNADLVVMTAYAPLFCNVNGWQWRPDLIWFDSLNVFGTPNYYVQQAFSLNRGDVVLPVSLDGQAGLYVTAARDKAAGQIILKVVNAGPQPATVKLNVQGAKVQAKGHETVLTGDLNAQNSFDKAAIAPAGQDIDAATGSYTFKPYSLTVLRLSTK